MKLNEEKSKHLFQKAGLIVPAGERFTQKDIGEKTPSFAPPWVLKIQVLSGGRGKAGGIRIVEDADTFATIGRELLSTPFQEEIPPALLVEPKIQFTREMYISLMVNRAKGSLSLTTGRSGGVEIEQLGPENLLSQSIHPLAGPADHQIRAAFFHLGLARDLWPSFRSLVLSLHRIVVEHGALLAEINPLVLTDGGEILPLDGKVELDDNRIALSPELESFLEPAHFSLQENRARKADLSYVRLNGWVGLMVNGAGLAMATMDQLNFAGLPAANFLDLGGAADENRIKTALDLLFEDTSVHAVLINIFGGILSCEKVAAAMGRVLRTSPPAKPVVLRLSGHGAVEGRRILTELSPPRVFLADDLSEALSILAGFAPSSTPAPKITSSDASNAVFSQVNDFSPERTILGLGKGTPVLVQGITGREGQLHTKLMQEFGTNIVAGVTPFKGGTEVLGVPVYDTVRQAIQEKEIRASIIFVPAPFAPDAVEEAAEAEIPLIVCITEGIPQSRMLQV
ncbi:MAG: ATP-grasp domain-containing protein, partial [Desulfovibrionales bacterium]